MLRRRTWIIPALVLIPLLAVAGNDSKKTRSAKSSSTTSKPAAKPAPARKSQGQRGKQGAAKKVVELTREQEEAATAFVTKHHDDLLELLIHLKEGLPQEYNRAIRDLSRTSERLQTLAARDKLRYELELKRWQAESRRQLLTARLQMGSEDALIQQIRETLVEEHRLQLAVFKHERERFAARVKKLDEQIARQEKTEQSSVERQLGTLDQSGEKQRTESQGQQTEPAGLEE